MIVQTRRASGFGAVLRGTLTNIEPVVDGYMPVLCLGNKAATHEPYEFRILLTLAEFELLTSERHQRGEQWWQMIVERTAGRPR